MAIQRKLKSFPNKNLVVELTTQVIVTSLCMKLNLYFSYIEQFDDNRTFIKGIIIYLYFERVFDSRAAQHSLYDLIEVKRVLWNIRSNYRQMREVAMRLLIIQKVERASDPLYARLE